MGEFHLLSDIYNCFATLMHYPVEQFCSFQSVFPRLQAATINHLVNPLPDICFFKSAFPFICGLGKAKTDMTNIEATVPLISLNTLHVITHSFKKVKYWELSKDDRNDIIGFLRAIIDVIGTIKSKLNQDKSKITDLLDDIERMIDMIDKNSEEKVTFKTILATTTHETQLCTRYIRSRFKSLFSNSDYSTLFPYLMQISLDLQTFGLFALVENQYEEFEANEAFYLKAIKCLFEGDQDNSVKLLKTLSEKFNKLSKAKQVYLNSLYAAAATSVADSSSKLSEELIKTKFSKCYETFSIQEPETVPVQFSESVISLLSTLQNGESNHDITKQLSESLISYTDNRKLQWICNCAITLQDLEIGYVSLMGAFLPLTITERIKHFTTFINSIQQCFIYVESQIKNKIQQINYDIPPIIAEEYSNVDEIKTLHDAMHSFVIYTTILSSMKEKNINDETLLNNMTNLSMLLCSWFIGTSIALQSTIISFVPNLIRSVEKHITIKKEQLEIIHHLFDNISMISFDITSPNNIKDFIELVSKCMYGMLPLINELMNESPISIISSEEDFTQLLEYANISFNLFNELQKAIEVIDFSSKLYLRQQIRSLINPISNNINNILNTLEKKDVLEYYINEAQVNIMSYIFGLSIVDRNFDKNLAEFYVNLLKSSNLSEMKDIIENINKVLKVILQQASAVDVTQSMLNQIDINSEQDITNLIQMITNPTLQESSKQLVIEILNLFKDESKILRNQYKNQILSLLALRVNGYQQYEISKLMNITDDELIKNSISIFASLPLNAPKYSKEIQQFSLPLLYQTDIYQMRQSLRNTISFLTITIRIRESCHIFLEHLHGEDTDVNKEIYELVQSLELNNIILLSKNKNPHLRSIYDICKLYSYSNKTQFNEKLLENKSNEIFESNDLKQIESITQSLLLEYISTSIINNCFHIDILLNIKDTIISLNKYLNDPTNENKRELYSACLMFTTEFNPVGNINEKWCIIFGFCLSYIENMKEDALNYIKICDPNNTYQTFMEYLDLVHVYDETNRRSRKQSKEPVQPIIMKRFIKKTRKPDPIIIHKVIKRIIKTKKDKNSSTKFNNININSNLIKLIELSKLIENLFERIKKEFEKLQNVNMKLVNEFIDKTKELINCLNQSADLHYILLSSTLENIIENIKTSTDEYDDYLINIKQILNDLILTSLKKYGITNLAFSEIIIMKIKLETLQNEIKNKILVNEIQNKNSFNEKIIKKFLNVLDEIGILCNLTLDQIEFIINKGEIFNDEETLVNSILQTSLSSQMIYYMLEMLYNENENDNNEMKLKIVAICTELKHSLSHILIGLKTNNNMSVILNKKIESEVNKIVSELQNIKNETEKLCSSDKTVKEEPKKNLSLAVQRRNAGAAVTKKRREVEEVEEEIKRLNRAIGTRNWNK